MDEMTVADGAPIEVGPILSSAFRLIGNEAPIVFGIGLITVIPLRLLDFALIEWGVLPHERGASWLAFALAMLGSGLLGSVMQTFGAGALAGTALAKRAGAPAGFLETLAPALRCLPVIVPAALLYMIAIVAGMIFLIVPGIIAAMMWSVIGPVIVVERTGILEAFRRSQTLTDNTLGRIFLLSIAENVFSGLFGWSAGRLGSLFFDTGGADMDYVAQAAPFLFQTLVTLATAAFSIALNCALYVALIERRGDGPMTDRLARIFE